MPTINEYKNDTGYYIRAWTPDTGNINYKVRQTGNAIVEDYGLSDGDDISWETIQSLKTIGEIYTEGNGTFGPEDVNPPDGSAKSLTESEAKSLLGAILSKENPSESEIERLCEILGVDSPQPDAADGLAELLESRIVGTGVLERIETTETLGGDVSSPTLSIQVEDKTNQDGNPLFCLKISLMDASNGDISLIRHEAHICEEHGLEAWYLACSGEVSWQKQAEMNQQKSLLLPPVIQLMNELEIECGSPDDDFGTWTFEVRELLEAGNV